MLASSVALLAPLAFLPGLQDKRLNLPLALESTLSEAAFSPDGAYVAYLDSQKLGMGAVDGSGFREIPAQGFPSDLRFGPDSAGVYFLSDVFFSIALYRVSVTGGAATVISQTGRPSPSWPNTNPPHCSFLNKGAGISLSSHNLCWQVELLTSNSRSVDTHLHEFLHPGRGRRVP